MRSASASVARYYDHNTASFLARGEGGSVGAIHRAVWGEGVSSRTEAMHYVHGLLRQEASLRKARRILDLGCGTGASLAYVLEGSDAVGFGVSNSAVHVSMTRERLDGRATIELGDFCTDPLPPAIDLAFGIESFVQGPDSKAFFANVARSLAPSARLVLCDDFLEAPGGREANDARWVQEFKRGWHASSLMAPERADAIAAVSGLELVVDRDFTELLELDRPRDRALGALFAIAAMAAKTGAPDRIRSLRSSPRWQCLSGGNALRQCLKRGLVRYRYRVWQKL